MAVRIRSNGDIVCAAMNPEEPGDTYLDDELHYELSAKRGLLVTEPHERHVASGGRWWWKGQAPSTIDPFYLEQSLGFPQFITDVPNGALTGRAEVAAIAAVVLCAMFGVALCILLCLKIAGVIA